MENTFNECYLQTPAIAEPGWIPIAKWIRVGFGNEYVASSRLVMLKRGFPLVYYFPRKDVNMDLLERNNQGDQSDNWGSKISWHIGTKEKKAENAAFSYEKPADKAPRDIEKYVAFQWNAMDIWLEEDEEVRVHPRDPYHRIDVCNSPREIKIVAAGEVLAESNCPVLLFETGLPVRFYIPKTNIRMGMLEPTSHQTHCPYKGTANYYTVREVSGNKMENLVWFYPFPNEEVFKIKNLAAFFTERLDEVFVDGVKLPEMKTKWST